MKHTLLLFILILFSFSSSSQNEEAFKAFDSVFYHVAINVSSANPGKAMHMADSLFTYSVNDKQRLKSLMLKADILEKQEKRGEAIEHALEALKLAKQQEDYSFEARIYGFLSTQYRTIGFLDKGKDAIKNGVAVSFNIKNKDQVTKYRAMADQEMAEYALEEEEYDSAIEYLTLAMHSYENEDNPEFRYFLIGNTDEMIARAYLGLNNIEKTLEHFSKANININKAQAGNSLWAALIYQGYANAFLINKNIDSAQVYIKKALLISENGNHGSLKQSVYKTTADYYRETNNLDSVSKYDAKYYSISNENNAKKKAMVNRAYQTLNEKPETVSEDKTLYIIIGVLLLVGLVIFFTRKMLLTKTNDNKKQAVDMVIPKKTEQEILQKLAEFEASNDFLDKDISMSVLIGRLNTNTKYLRQVLKKHKEKDYNNYINELRINYILDKLQTNPEYLNYKISYLADESGFSSHSKFSSDFKSIVGLSPTEFINKIQN